ncbi:MAG: transcriptional regulator [Phormidesmis sp.]
MRNSMASDKTIVDENYGKLLQLVQPRRIETKYDYEKFLTLLEELLGKEESESLSEQESLLIELLLVIVQEYESQNVSLPELDPRDILLHLMEAQELKQTNLVGAIGSSGVVSEIVNGKREISKAQARSLGELFNVSYKLFL